jgi:hypothetical protein
MGRRGGPSFEAVFGQNYNKNKPGKTAANYAIIGGIVLAGPFADQGQEYKELYVLSFKL